MAPILLAICVLVAGASYDPLALAAQPKLVVGLGLSVVGLGLAHRLRRAAGHALEPPLLLLAALLAWVLLRVPGSEGGGWLSAAPMVLLLAVALLATKLTPAQSTLGLMVGAAGLGSASSLVALAERLQHAPLHGLQGNPNWLGLTLALTVWPTLLLWVELRGRRSAALLWPLVALQLGGLVVAESRTAWLALAATGVLLASCQRRSGPGRHAGALWISAALLSTLIFAALAGPTVGAPGSPLGSFTGRQFIWQNALAATQAAPLLGNGTGSFAHAYLAAQSFALNQLTPAAAAHAFENATTAHNEWLHTWVEQGAVGLLLLSACLAHALQRAWERRALPALAVVGSLAVCCIGDSPLHAPACVLLLGVALGGLSASGSHSSQRSPRPRLAAAATYAPLLAAALLLPLALRDYLAQRALARARGATPALAVVELQLASELAPSHGEAALEYGLALQRVGRQRDALLQLSRSRSLLANVGTDVALGNSHFELGELPEAEHAYRAALASHPAFFRAHANLVAVLTAAGELRRAREHLEIARRLQPYHPKLLDAAERLRRAELERATGPS